MYREIWIYCGAELAFSPAIFLKKCLHWYCRGIRVLIHDPQSQPRWYCKPYQVWVYLLTIDLPINDGDYIVPYVSLPGYCV